MRIDPRAALAIAMLLAGCTAAGEGPRPIPVGADCAVCGMGIVDLRYACEDADHGRFRFFDSIECLIASDPPAGRAWLADYDTKTLHAADSLWVLHGDIPSPMGGGYAAFLERDAADDVARARGGRVTRLAAVARGGTTDMARVAPGGAPRTEGS